MSYFSLILATVLFCNVGFSNDSLTRRTDEHFFDYVCRIKQLELSSEEAFNCRVYLKEPSAPFTAYLKTLDGIFREQLALPMGPAAEHAPRDLVDKKVAGLIRSFLQDKLGLHKPIHARHDLAQRAKWDPHFHGSSLFADYFPKARLYLPNYEEAYGYMKQEHRQLKDRTLYIKEAMEGESFATVTEAGSGYDNKNAENGVQVMGSHRASRLKVLVREHVRKMGQGGIEPPSDGL